jgi:hypothetical protein
MDFEKKILLNGPDDGTGIVWPVFVVPHVIVIRLMVARYLA